MTEPAEERAQTEQAQVIAQAVEATLTAIARRAEQEGPTPAELDTPTPPALILPPPLPDWRFAEKPYAQKGSPEAPVVLLEYSDFQCPWCLRFYQQITPRLAPLIESGDLRFIYKQFPILGPASLVAAQAAECAGAQGDFWSMHDWLFDNQATWKGRAEARQLILEAAPDLGYDADALGECMEAESTLQAIGVDFQEARRYGLRGTPSLMINGRLIPGFLPWERFGPLVEAVLAQAQGRPLPAGVTLAPTPPPLDLDFEEEEFAVAGRPDAPVTIYEFSDYQCPFCARFYREVKPLLDARYIATGQVRFVYKDFPLDDIHPQARLAAQAAECAGAQGRYWPMHDRLFEGVQEWGGNERAGEIFARYAEELGLDVAAFSSCLARGVYAEEVQADFEEGQRAAVSGTPTFFINGRRLVGAQPFAAFEQVIEEILADSPQAPAGSSD